MKRVDIVIPVMNEEEVLSLFYYEVTKVTEELKEYKFNLLFVDDGSSDKTLAKIKELARSDRNVKYISFSRNFGKEAAIYAGLSHTTGDRVILMDGDLEHPPELMPSMLAAIDEEGFEACGAKRQSGLMSRMFSGLNNQMSSVKLQKGATDYMCMTRRFVDAVMMLSETQRFTKGLFAWVGFDVKWIDYEQPVRPGGQSKWNIRKLFNYAADGLTSFSTKPLRMVTLLGLIVCFLAFVYIVITLVHTLITGIEVPGYVTTLVVMLFLGGVIILSIGILGEYIGRIYLESKDRPMYIMKQTNIGSANNKAKKPERPARNNPKTEKAEKTAGSQAISVESLLSDKKLPEKLMTEKKKPEKLVPEKPVSDKMLPEKLMQSNPDPKIPEPDKNAKEVRNQNVRNSSGKKNYNRRRHYPNRKKPADSKPKDS